MKVKIVAVFKAPITLNAVQRKKRNSIIYEETLEILKQKSGLRHVLEKDELDSHVPKRLEVGKTKIRRGITGLH